MNKAELKQLEVEKIMALNEFKRFYPEAYERAFPSPIPVAKISGVEDWTGSAIDEVVEVIEDNFEITEDIEEADVVVVVHDEPTLQEELEEIIEEAVEDIVEVVSEAEILPVPEDSQIQDFLSNLLETDEDKLVEILKKLK